MNELYDGRILPLSEEDRIRTYQQKLINGDEVSDIEQEMYGRNIVVKEINSYKLKPNYAYRVVSEKLYNEYLKRGFISSVQGDEYSTENGEKGIDWFLGGACLDDGIKDNFGQIQVVIEVPASKKYFVLARDNGCGQTNDPYVRSMKSSGHDNPIPTEMITTIIKRNFNTDKSIIEKPQTEKLFSHRSTAEKKVYEQIKQKNQIISYQGSELEEEDVKKLMKTNKKTFEKSGFANIIIISSTTLIVSFLLLFLMSRFIR